MEWIVEAEDLNDLLNGRFAVETKPLCRCKDCKHRHEAECPMYHEEDIEWDDDGYIERDTIYHDWTEDDGFCDRGERRDDGEEVH